MTVFLSAISQDDDLHELDFRFEFLAEDSQFLFAHHGLTLSDLAETIDLTCLGTYFYMVEAESPFTLQQVIADPGLFLEQYGVYPTVVSSRHLGFDRSEVDQFFRGTSGDNELDCTMIGFRGGPRSETELDQLIQPFLEERKPELRWEGSWLHTHDNHFHWLVSQSPSLLRRLISETIVGFFYHVHRHSYRPVPDALLDLIVAEYHTAPIVCFPTEFVKGNEVLVAVQCDADGVHALLETAESSWIAHRLNPPWHLVGRGLLVTYRFGPEVWHFEPWE